MNSSCVNGDVRLIGGSSENEGRVEICRDSVWAAVAHKGWDQREAQVVCKQLGFPYECKCSQCTVHCMFATALCVKTGL